MIQLILMMKKDYLWEIPESQGKAPSDRFGPHKKWLRRALPLSGRSYPPK